MGKEPTFGLEIYSSSQIFFRGRASSINLPATDGGHTFLAHHENVVVALVPGETTFTTEGGETVLIATGAGFAEMVNNRVQVFVHSAEKPEDIDVNRAREAKERAEEQLRQKQSLKEYHRTKLELARAMSRLSAARKRH